MITILPLLLLAPMAQRGPALPELFWSQGILGSHLGDSGFVVLDVSGAPELVLGGSTGSFSSNDRWQSLQRNANGAWQSSFVSEIMLQGVRSLGSGRLTFGANPSLLVLREDGIVEIRDGTTKNLQSTFDTGLGTPLRLVCADLDGDTVDEILVVNGNKLRIYTAAGIQTADVGHGGDDVVVAQMDQDPQPEIAVGSGVVLDGASLQPQWTWPPGFGDELAAADIDGDGMDELITMPEWSFIECFDVELGLPRWSLPTGNSNDAIEVVDLEGDGSWEILYAPSQFGPIQCFDALTTALLWSIPNLQVGAGDLIAFDADLDGDLEVAWTSGHGNSGADTLLIADWQTTSIQWSSVHLDGPFIGPVRGDLDGDGLPELVVATRESEAGYDNGWLLIYDGVTHELLASALLHAEGRISEGVQDLELYDLEGDGRKEIVVAADASGTGWIGIHKYGAGVVTEVWSNARPRPDASPFLSVACGDVNLDGELDLIAGGSRGPGGLGTHLYSYGYATDSGPLWRSLQMGSGASEITELAIADTDGDGAPEILGMVEGGDLYVFDGVTKALEALILGSFTAMTVYPAGPRHDVMLGDANGVVTQHSWSGSQFTTTYTGALAADEVDGVALAGSGLVLLGSAGRLHLVALGSTNTLWSSGNYAGEFGARTVIVPGFPLRFYTAGHVAIAGFKR